MVDLRRILVPQFQGSDDELLALVQQPKPLVVLLVGEPIESNDGLVGVFERLARDFVGKINIYWVVYNFAGALARIFPGKQRPSITIIRSGKEIGTFFCQDSEPGIYFDVEEALKTAKPGHFPSHLQPLPVSWAPPS